MYVCMYVCNAHEYIGITCNHMLCVYKYKQISKYIYIYIYIYIHRLCDVHTHAHMYICICTYAYVHIHIHLHTYRQTYIHTYIHTDIRTYIHTCIHTCMHTRIHRPTHRHRCISGDGVLAERTLRPRLLSPQKSLRAIRPLLQRHPSSLVRSQNGLEFRV